MHPALRLPYAAIAFAADAAARLPLPGDSKVVRTLRARRDALTRLTEWGSTHRDPSRPLLWLHAPSVGEGLQARPVLELLKDAHPDWQFCYTFFSPSAERFAATLPVDVRGYLPFDRRANAERLLDALRPTALVFSKLDVWPTLTERAAARGVALGLISATMSEGSGRRGMLAQALSREAFAALQKVGAVDATDADRLVATGVQAARITITGDTRYDQVAARSAATDRASALLRPLQSTRPTVVAGSTWPADEQVLLAAWRALRVALPDVRLIIAPHEPTNAHLNPIRRWASESGLSLASLSEARGDADVVLVDRVGVLGELYALADAAFVGGAFHAAGLHSVLEPAAYGLPVIFGPRYHGSRDARLLTECRGGEAVHDVQELVRALRILLTEEDTRRRAGSAALAMVREGLGAAERSARMIEQLTTDGRRKTEGEPSAKR
jgi:3-deoxy-D-manno-octulosonic-acid transferase